MATTKKTTAAKKAAPKKATPKKAAPKKTQKVQEPQHIGLVRDDSWLEPFEQAIRGRHDHAVWKINQLTRNGKSTLSQFASSQHSRSLLLVICILDSINWLKVGCSVSGLPMLRRFT